MESNFKFPLNPPGSELGQVLLVGADGFAIGSDFAGITGLQAALDSKQNIYGAQELHIGFLLKWGVHTVSIATVARTSNIATVTTNAAHGMLVGQKVEVNASTDNSFDATGSAYATIIAIPTATSFTYANTGSDKSQTADSGTLTTWEVVTDANHGSNFGAVLSSISASGITVGWNALPTGTWKISSATFGNHQNNSSGKYTPIQTGVGLNTCGIALRHRETIWGRAYWNGTKTGGGVTTNANWVKEGHTNSALFDPGQNAAFIGHSSYSLPTFGSRGVSSWPLPKLQAISDAMRPVLPNYQVSPFTAAGYQPSATGFYFQLIGAAGTILTQTEIEAILPASKVQFMWERTVDTVLQDHTRPDGAVTVFASVHMVKVA